MPQVAIFLERGGNQRFEARRYQRVDVGDRLRRAVEDRVEDNRLRAAAERLNPGGHLIEHDAKREEIGACIDVFAPCLLG